MALPSIGVHTLITNPLSSGYLSYLASIDSWTKVCDELIIVDGGSNDGSIDFLFNWLPNAQKAKVRLISTPESYWGPKDQWSWPQLPINRQLGLEALQTDWAIHIDADHVININSINSVENIRSKLAEEFDTVQLDFWVGSFVNGKYIERQRRRPWILNKKKVLSEKLSIGYGLDTKTEPADRLVWIEDSKEFTDPLTGILKTYFIGEPAVPQKTLDIECLRYGHAFFSIEQCIHKDIRLEQARNRYFGRPPRTIEDIKKALKLNEIERFMTKQELLNMWHPEEILRIIEHFYNENMLIGALYKPTTVTSNILSHFLKLNKSK